MFLLTETSARPYHAGALVLFDVPEGEDSSDFAGRMFDSFRGGVPVAPWNRIPVIGIGSRPHWKSVDEFDPEYHVRRLTLPPPGSMEQLMELSTHLYPGLLDRSRPLWEAYVVDGLDGRRVALFLKAHHALADGISGVRMFHRWLSESPGDELPPLWAAAPEARPRPMPRQGGALTRIDGHVQRASGIAKAVLQLADAVPANVRLLRGGAALPMTAAPMPTMAARVSSARSFAIADLPLDQVRRIAKQHGGTVTDFVLSLCDEAMQRYVVATGGTQRRRMVTSIAISTRRGDDAGGGNSIATALVPLGAPDAAPAERLEQIVRTTKRVKTQLRRTSPLALMLQTFGVAGAFELRERLPVGRGTVPHVANFTVSNIPGGPEEERYLGPAKVAAVYILPIVMLGQEANFTVLSFGDRLCVGIGAARNIIRDTGMIAKYIEAAFEELVTA